MSYEKKTNDFSYICIISDYDFIRSGGILKAEGNTQAQGSSQEEPVQYQNVVKTAPSVSITANKRVEDTYNDLNEGQTLAYPFTLSKESKIVLRFTEHSYGKLSYAIFNSNGSKEFEESLTDVDFSMILANTAINKTLIGNQRYLASPGLGTGIWKTSDKKVIRLSRTSGNASTLILVKQGRATVTFENNIGYVIYEVTVKRYSKTIRKSLTSCDIFVANPKQGTGSWKVGNKKIASISRKSGAKVTVRGKNKGTTTVTFKNGLVTYHYKITVKVGRTYPIEAKRMRIG